MKVISSGENHLEFDNGLIISGLGDQDCCAFNFIDFDQFVVGEEFPTLTAGQFVDTASFKDDGFALKDSQGLPKWAQARSEQNGYYSNMTTLEAEYDGKTIKVAELSGDVSY